MSEAHRFDLMKVKDMMVQQAVEERRVQDGL